MKTVRAKVRLEVVLGVLAICRPIHVLRRRQLTLDLPGTVHDIRVYNGILSRVQLPGIMFTRVEPRTVHTAPTFQRKFSLVVSRAVSGWGCIV